MGTPTTAMPVKLFASLFAAAPEQLHAARRPLERAFGPIDFTSEMLTFAHTDYYRAEFGGGLVRHFITFTRPMRREGIARVKLVTNRIEERLAMAGRRTVNIDPGYLTLAKVVLLTTKDYAHRLYLGRGIFAEVTLHYSGGTYRAWPWTYPDYRSRECIDIFQTIRRNAHKELVHPCS